MCVLAWTCLLIKDAPGEWLTRGYGSRHTFLYSVMQELYTVCILLGALACH